MTPAERFPLSGLERCGGLDPAGREVECLGEDEGDREAGQKQDDEKTQRPDRQFPSGKNGGGELNDAAGGDHVSCRHPVDFAPL